MTHAMPWYPEIYNFLMESTYPLGASKATKERLESDAKYYICDDLYLWRLCNDQVYFGIRNLIGPPLLSCSSRRRPLWIRSNSSESLRLWAILAHYFLRRTYLCLSLRTMLESRNGNKPKVRNAPVAYSLIMFQDGWRLGPSKLMTLKFSVPKALINDQGTHFCNHAMATLLEKYGVVHQVATAFHPQTNDQAEVFNREIKKLLQKMENPSQNDWCRLLEDAL
ncbi:hypothetical protein CR513_49622, partial [Mucuna pruriens]